ncbi:hypothetical protein F4861DRAFT_516635 [Xylaria intraflava]|nr:hypothetical protein F4861DRAFT_516635 [Xylaria intraflava]
MEGSIKQPANPLVAGFRKVHNLLGFTKGYNFMLWFVFAGAFSRFAITRLAYINFWGFFCNEQRPRGTGAMPGECFYYTKPGRYHIGIMMHLIAVLPATLLACLQFAPVIRRKAMFLHRIMGYISVALAIVGTLGAVMIFRPLAGGGLDVQSGVGLLAIMFMGALIMAIINIRRLQIEQHRAWMIRAWVYGGCVVTTRLLLIIFALFVSYTGGYYTAQPCNKISMTLKGKDATMTLYPQCLSFFSGENPDQHVLVKANFFGNVIEITSALNLAFGTAVWVSLLLHMVGVELYLHLTSAEHERLRNLSYRRQLKKGMENPGSAGWIVDPFGDEAKWTPKSEIKDAGNTEKPSKTSKDQ